MHQASVGFHCPECVVRRGARPVTASRQMTASASRPVATRVLLALNGLAFLYSVAASRSARGITRIDGGVLEDGSLLARAVTLRGGGLELIGVDAGEYYRLVTSAFLHDGIFHLAFNMYILWILGQMLEAGFGRARFLSLFVVSMFGGAFGALLLSAPNSPTVGASGAVFGLMGAAVLVHRAVGGSIWRSPLAPLLMLNIVFTLLIPRISIGGHFGGLIAGAFLGALMLALERRNAPVWATVSVGGMLSALLVAGSVFAAAQ
ncbi:MAG: rhomboid family intramembrane serine protease [Acidimicrobiaceae bacterium]|nr:rhomboid family intramembrane serine protease [Acidimicrobiaceae bacterium]MXZ97728.1 rhomboid family intramembrane serine protease [Acidimicrobiaceae bacterium]MYE96849.1 rhomboid family intramembrane serine protease [Acidimicrobiaceae bacterium]MYI53795.1 rhomboid family intramembrane serine protease [Acidimicrobiaceae bacterium]MYJ41302.1 rhomboid family intramembrane serine protease [Acidimicrobiaceae bacterium]